MIFLKIGLLKKAVLYADNSTEIIVEEDPNVLESKLQMQASLIFNSKLFNNNILWAFQRSVNPAVMEPLNITIYLKTHFSRHQVGLSF